MSEIRNRHKPAATPGGLTKLEHAAIMLTAGLNAAGPYDCLHREVAADGMMQAHALFDSMEKDKWGEQRQTMDDRLLRAEHDARFLAASVRSYLMKLEQQELNPARVRSGIAEMGAALAHYDEESS